MSSIPAVRLALVNALADLFPDAQATYGVPGVFQADEVAAVTRARADVSRPTLGGSVRSREEAAEVSIIFSAYRPGDESVQPEADEAANAMLTTFESWLRTGDNIKLGGACREAWVSGIEDWTLYPLANPGPSPQSVAGYVAEITVTVSTATRI